MTSRSSRILSERFDQSVDLDDSWCQPRLGGLILENFKAFRERQRIPFAPLTLIFGPNSAGKSSILQSLLLLKQTHKADPNGPAVQSRGQLVDLGDFSDFVSNHDHTRTCEIAPLLRYTDLYNTRTGWVNIWESLGFPDISFGLGFQLERDKDRNHPRFGELPVYIAGERAFSVVHKAAQTWVRGNVGSGTVRVDRFNPDHPLWPHVFAWSCLDESSTVRDLTLLQMVLQDEQAEHSLREASAISFELESLTETESPDAVPAVAKETMEQWRFTSKIAHEGRLLYYTTIIAPPLEHVPSPLSPEQAETVRAYLEESSSPEKTKQALEILVRVNDAYGRRAEVEQAKARIAREWEEWKASAPYGLVEGADHDLISTAIERFTAYDLARFIEDIEGTSKEVENESSPSHAWRVHGLRFWNDDLLPTNAISAAASFLTHRDYPNLMPGDQDRPGSINLPHLIHITQDFSKDLDNLLERIVYLGPQRSYPGRFELVTRSSQDQVFSSSVGVSGESTLSILAGDSKALERTNRWLLRFGMGYQVQVDPVGIPPAPGQDIPSGLVEALDRSFVRLCDARTDNTVVELRDVGFGVSQVLPLIVQCSYQSCQVLLVEQPELHLHPRLQAHLGSLFAEAVQGGTQIVAETHSQHLILRVQRLIREGKLKPSDVSVLYVERGPDGSTCMPLEMDENGDFIDDWPHGFFDEAYNEMFGLSDLPGDEGV